MRGTWWQRACAVAFAGWFAVFGVERSVIGACVLHESAPSADASSSGAHGLHSPPSATGQHAGHVGHAGSAGFTAHTVSAPEHTGHFSCAGDCCCPSTRAVPAIDVAHAPVVRVAVARQEPTARERTVERIDYLLPFPTAPPSSRIG